MNIEALTKRDYLWLGLAIGLFFLIGLGGRAYMIPSEARYIEIPRQMLVTHDWLTPRINGVPYFEKPPLFYWMQAAVMSMFGTGEFAGRIVTALLAVLNCLATYAIGKILYGRSCGLLAAALLATCVLGYGMSRLAMLDMPVTLFLTLCLGSFLAAQRSGNGNWYYAMYASAALAVMTKGLIGMVIPGMVIGAWIAITRQWRLLLRVRLFSGLLLFLAIALPWHVLMMREHPEFFNFYIIHEHFARFLTEVHRRDEPWWFFIMVTLAGLLPWTWLLPQAVGKTRHDVYGKFLLLWAALPFLFFSFSDSKLVPYIFPIFPALALMIAHYLAGRWHTHARLQQVISGLMAVMIIIGIGANYIEPRFNQRSIKPLALDLKARLRPGDMVVAYGEYWHDLPVYLDRNVSVADWKNELEFGMTHYPQTREWMIDESTMIQRCISANKGFYIVMRKDSYDHYGVPKACPVRLVATYGRAVLLQKGTP